MRDWTGAASDAPRRRIGYGGIVRHRFPANIDMAVHAWQGDGGKGITYGRLPLQIHLVLWALYIDRGTLSWRGHSNATGG